MLQPNPQTKDIYNGLIPREDTPREIERPPLACILSNRSRQLAYLAIRPYGLHDDPGLVWLIDHASAKDTMEYVDDLIDDGSQAASLARFTLRRKLELSF